MWDRYAWMPFPFRLTAGLLGDTKRTLQPDKPHRDPCWYMVCQTTSRFCRGLQLPLKAECVPSGRFHALCCWNRYGKKILCLCGLPTVGTASSPHRLLGHNETGLGVSNQLAVDRDSNQFGLGPSVQFTPQGRAGGCNRLIRDTDQFPYFRQALAFGQKAENFLIAR